MAQGHGAIVIIKERSGVSADSEQVADMFTKATLRVHVTGNRNRSGSTSLILIICTILGTFS